MGIVGLMKTGAADAACTFKNPDRTVMLLGGLGACDAVHFGGTQYAKVIVEESVGTCRRRSIWITRSECRRPSAKIVNEGLAESAHDLSDGGLAVALAESSFGPRRVGADIASRFRLAAGIPAVP